MERYCKKHGWLQEKDIRISKCKNNTRLKCRLCCQEWDTKRNKNPIRIAYKRENWILHHRLYPEKNSIRKKLENENLTNGYIIKLLCNRSTNLTANDIPVALIELKREAVKLKRLILARKNAQYDR